MKSVKVMPRFQCDFCRRRSTLPAMKKHEQRCFKNPNRYCDACKNTKKVMGEEEHPEYVKEVEVDCLYCLKYDEYLTKTNDQVCRGCGQDLGKCSDDCPAMRYHGHSDPL